MIDLWYLNIKNISQLEVSASLRSLPVEMANNISRFRDHGDRTLKLFGKLMVKKYYEDKNMPFKWSDLHVSAAGKPYYNGSEKFNISHSGDYVTVAFSNQEIGNDIEKITAFDIASVAGYLHPKEAECIDNASNPEDIFFKIWTRKEAYLKAIGKGIIDGMDHENCLQNKLTHNETWYLHSPSIIPGYQIALCTQITDCHINTRELFPDEFKERKITYEKIVP